MSLDDRDWWREDRRRKEKHQVENMYGTLMQMDYADVFSTDYEYHHSFEEMLLK